MRTPKAIFILLAILLNIPTVVALAYTITSIEISWVSYDPTYNVSNAIKVRRCLNASSHWLTSEVIQGPNIGQLGAWKYGAINTCQFNYPVINARTDQVYKICVGAADSDPGAVSGLYNHPNNRCFKVWRSGSGVAFNEVFNVYGWVTDASGSPLAGVAVVTTNGINTQTGPDGHYGLGDIDAGSTTITVSKAGYLFTPSSRIVSGGPPYWVNEQNFSATPEMYSVSGRVTETLGQGVANIVISAGVFSATTNSTGFYSVTLPSGIYTLNPIASGMTFTPSVRSIVITNAALANQDFLASSPILSIAGQITDTLNNPLIGVVVRTGNITTTTNISGSFSFTGLPPGAYTVTPLLNGWEFSPTSRTVNLSTTNLDGLAYLGQDVTAPTGFITTPIEGSTLTPGAIFISAEANDFNGLGIAQVNFKVFFNGSWNDVGAAVTPPYKAAWSIPVGLHTQKILFAMQVVDKAGNIAIDPGGQRSANYIESQTNPNVNENRISRERLAYLNQLSLPQGNKKCGAASVAMMLAINGRLAKDWQTLSTFANTTYQSQNPYWHLLDVLNKNGMQATYYRPTRDNGWALIKQEINAGRPLIMLSDRLANTGHYIVIIGYREESGHRQIIVYDPVGAWSGIKGKYAYNRNGNLFGQGPTYDFANAWGYNGSTTIGRLITAHLTAGNSLQPLEFVNSSFEPDIEPPLPSVYDDVYEGGDIQMLEQLFLPLVID